MIRYPRLPEPSGFAAATQRPKAELERAVGAGAPLAFPSTWKKYKKPLLEAQHHKCGYCECRLTGHGDVEHYAPKAEVHVGGVKYSPGYWWRAYDWTNYLVACPSATRHTRPTCSRPTRR